VSESWYNLSTLESVSNMISDIILGPSFTVFLLEIKCEVEALLIGKAVKRASESSHTSGIS